MQTLPDFIIKAWNNKKGPIILTTVNKENKPNSIYATCVSLYDSSTILIVDNFLNKTKQNIFEGSHGVVLFISAGVFYFFNENRIKNFFITLANHFKTCDIFLVQPLLLV